MGSHVITIFTVVSFFLCCILCLPPLTDSAGQTITEFLRPDFNASQDDFIDNSGTFLSSRNSKFVAALTNTDSSVYFAVLHADSKTIIWSANRNSPISYSSKLNLTLSGISLSDDDGKSVWSTPPFNSTVSLLQLQENGNLVLLDPANRSLWESFDHPTDTIVAGQRLPVGESLVGSLSETDLSGGDYQFTVAGNDPLSLWNGLVYWKLTMDLKANTVSTLEASYIAVNGTGLYLFGAKGSVIVIQLVLGATSDFRIAKLEPNGRFTVKSFQKLENWTVEFQGPADDCQIPSICGRIGLCSPGDCWCPPGFFRNSSMNNDCVPVDSSYSLPSPCSAAHNESNSLITYMKLGDGMDYFSNQFTAPVIYGVVLSTCEDLCSKNCTCLGIFHHQSLGSCYLLENQLGSIMSSSSTKTDRIGYIKALSGRSSQANPNGEKDKKRRFPVVGLVLLPLSGFLLVLTLAAVAIKKIRIKFGRRNSSSSADLELVIQGLPVRFDYKELVEATENFNLRIGSGGFGVVYKGTLKDKTVVAVKKIISLEVQGNREFRTEIDVIGNIHHFNLVRLKGYCTRGRQRFLIYEYMNMGSLDRILFGNGPVLKWQERFEIALSTARGLAYLHTGCDHKIIHCDVKPENILLNDDMQVKISDFGLSKLLSREQSDLITALRGTPGYLAPELLCHSAISDRSDVYSYGMVLLEIVRGKKNSNFSPESDSGKSSDVESSVYFPVFALEMHQQGRYLELVDPRLYELGGVTSEQVEKLVRVALCCVHGEATQRPSMSNVVSMLEGGLPLGEPRPESLNFLRFLGGRYAEAPAVATPQKMYLSHMMSSKDVSGPR